MHHARQGTNSNAKRRRPRLPASSILAAAGCCIAASAVPAQPEAAPLTAVPASPEPAEVSIEFAFKNAPFSEVIDFFAREAGLPVIFEADPPGASMTFVGGRGYSFDEALSILNLNLQRHDRHLRREADFLYLSTLPDAAKRAGNVFEGSLPEGIRADEIVTVTIPLNNALAQLVAEQVRPLLAPYGSVVAIPAQNMIVLVETGAQVERIRGVIDTIDRVRPADSDFRLFRLQNAKPDAVVGALRGLVGERIKRIIVDKDGNQRVVEETDIGDVTMQPDPRTNSILVMGPQSRIETIADLVDVLDAPENPLQAGLSEIVTVSLNAVSAEEAARTVGQLFASVPADRRPTVLPLPRVGKLALVGSPTLVMQATALIAEVDPDGGDGGSPERTVRVIALEHIDPGSAERVASRLLTPRQSQAMTFTASPDGRGLVVAGPTSDVEAFERLIDGIDRPARVRREVRVLDISAPDAESAIARAEELYAQAVEASDDPSVGELTRTYDSQSRSLTLVGARQDIERFVGVLQTAERVSQGSGQTRTYELERVRPSSIVPALGRLSRMLLVPDDGSRFEAPSFEPIDELGTLVVRARGPQFAVIEDLINKLTAEALEQSELRVVRLTAEDPGVLLERARELYTERTAGVPEAEAGEVRTEFDVQTGTLSLRGTRGGLDAFERAISEAGRFLPPPRTTRVIDIQRVDAQEIIEPLQELLATADPIDPARKVPEPAVRVLERTNSLLVTAESAQHRIIEGFVRRLDVIEPGDLPPLKLLQLRTADANAIAQMLTRQYQGRPQADRSARPVEVRSDPATNTLIVSAHEELFGEIREFVDELNKERSDGPERVTVLFPLKVARAVEVAQAMDKLYPQPPVPRDRRGQPMPWLQEQKEVTVSADAGSNSLIIDAPADRIDSLQELAQQLDRVEVPPAASLRTYRVDEADINIIASALNGLARRGVLSAPAQPGKQRVDVLIETEPRSKTLIVAGDDVTFAKVEQVLEDLSAVRLERELRIVPIANVNAEEIRGRALAIYEAQMAGLGRDADLNVSVDAESNSLEIVADNERLGRFLEILEELQRQAGPARQARILDLRFAQAGEVIEFLTDLSDSSRAFTRGGGPEPVFEPIEATNSILVAAQPDQFAIIDQLVRTVDNQETSDRPPLRILRLRSTDASNLADILNRSYAQRSSEERAKKPVSIQPDAATNTLVVSAHPEVLPEIESIVTELNETQALDDEDREIRIFPLRVARAQELARTIDAMFPEPPMPRDSRGRPRPDLQRAKEISVRADAATNSIIVDAPARRLAGFEQIVRSLDAEQLTEQVAVRTYRVQSAELSSVENTLRRLADSNAFGAAGRTPITISSQPATGTLVVAGPVSIFDKLEPVLEDLDGSSETPATSLRMYPLTHARADRLRPLLEQLLVTRVREEVGQGLSESQERSLLEVATDPASNTLIITAPEAVQAVAAELIASLDTEASAAGRNVVRIVPLTFADAGEVARVLAQTVPTMDLPSGTRPTILAPGGSNAVVLSGAAGDLDKLEELIEPLDARPTDEQSLSVETFALEHADASVIAQSVQRLLTDQLRLDPRVLAYRLRYSRGQFVPPPQARVEADDRTNSLVVSAPPATLELARSMIDRLDQPSAGNDRVVMTFTPARGEPERLARAVSQVLRETQAAGRDPVELVPEPATRSVVVIGTDEQVGEAVGLLTEFDERTVSVPGVDVRVFELEHARASSAAGAVQSMVSDRARWPRELTEALAAGVAVAEPRVTADAEANRLVVSVPQQLMPMVEAMVETLDAPSSRSSSDVRVFRLERGDARGVADALRQGLVASASPGEPEVRVTAEPRANAVVVSGSRERLLQAQGIVEELDQAATTDGSGVRTLFLEHARAERLAPVVQGVLERESSFDAVPWWERWRLLREGIDAPVPVRVVAEPSLNALVVSGPTAAIELAEQVARELDIDPSGSPNGLDRIVKVIALRNADVEDVARNVEVLTDDVATTEAPPAVRVDRASNTLIVRGTPGQIREIESLAGQLDDATVSGTRQFRRIAVDRSKADARELAETLRRLLGESTGRGVEVISIDQLLERTSGQEAPAGGESGGGSGGESSGGAMLPGVPQAWLVAVAMAQPGANGAETTEPEDPSEPITIAVDPVTNSLIVIGSPRLTERVAQLTEQLEAEFPGEAGRVRVIELPAGVDARNIASIVGRSVGELGRAGDANPGGMTGRVSVIPDASAGSLIVFANDTDFEAIAPIIRAVSVASEPEKLTVKVYPLSSVQGSDALRAVRDFISPRPLGRQARQLRSVELSLDGVTRQIDPALVSVTTDPAGSSLVVTAPDDAIRLIDKFVSVIDQSPVTDRMAIKRYEFENGQVGDIARTLQTLFDSQRAGARGVSRAMFVPDARTNTLLVTATSQQHEDVERLLPELDAKLEDPGAELAVIPLENARPSVVRGVVEQVVIGRDAAKRERVRISADDRSELFVVRASAEDIEEIRAIVERVDAADSAGLPIRTIRLERADAAQVSQALERFFRERGRLAGARGRGGAGGVAITGDRESGSLIVAANDEDFEQIRAMAASFDTPSPSLGASFEIIRLEHAQATDIGGTIQDIAWQVQWRQQRGGGNAPFFAEVNGGTNSLILYGEAETLDLVRGLVAELDQPEAGGLELVARSVRLERAEPFAVARVLSQTYATPGWQRWRGRDPKSVEVQVDRRQNALLLVGTPEQVELAIASVEEIDASGVGSEKPIVTIPLTHAQADRAARSLEAFFRDRAREQGVTSTGVSIVGSREGNVLLVSGDDESVALVRSLVEDLDRPELGDDREIRVFAVSNADANQVARTVQAMFPGSGRADDRVIVQAQAADGTLIVSAPEGVLEGVGELIGQLDAPPDEDRSRIVTVSLENARASDVAASLRAALPDGVRLRITSVARNNSLLLTGSDESISLAMTQIEQLDAEPVRSLVEYRRFRVQHADAFDVYFTLSTLFRRRGGEDVRLDYDRASNTIVASASADILEEIERVLEELDAPEEGGRRTEFVALEYAEALPIARALDVFYGPYALNAETPGARNVSIVPDEASNTLIISAAEPEWDGIRALLTKLDNEQYDTSRRLEVISLRYASAESVARAISEGYDRAVREEARRQEAERGGSRRDENDDRIILLSSEETPSVSAEPQTNSVIVFATGQQLERIRRLVEQIDRAEFADYPEARVIPVATGRATDLARSVREVFARSERSGRRGVVIVGDDQASSLVVRADDEEFVQIRALAESLQQRTVDAQAQRVSVRLLRLASVPAVRVRETLLRTFTPIAEDRRESLAIEIDATTNALVIASSRELYEQLEPVARELDAAMRPPAGGEDDQQPGVVEAAPAGEGAFAADFVGGAGQTVSIVSLTRSEPQRIVDLGASMGLTSPRPAGETGIVARPVRIVALQSRSAVAVVGDPADVASASGLLSLLDAEGAGALQEVRLVPLRVADAGRVAQTIRVMLRPGEQDAQTPGARAIAEQVRRLRVAGLEQAELDLASPIRLIPDPQTNSILVASTPGNVAAIAGVVAALDGLPVGDAVVVRMFPLENAAASRIKSVIDQLFRSGSTLRRVRGTQREAEPTTVTGQVLSGDLVSSIDERTNTLIVAGPEDAVAFVEVLVADLDGDGVGTWVEPVLVELEHADPVRLSEVLREVMQPDPASTPEAQALQRQVGRLRLVAHGNAPAEGGFESWLEADVFAPVSQLTVLPDVARRAILIVGTPANIEVARELVAMFDVPEAATEGQVRIFPLRYASADRVADLVEDVFDERQRRPDARAEDAVIVESDLRTNALVVSTSEQSLRVLEPLIARLDAEESRATVGLHVLTVEGANAEDLSDKIERLMNERLATTRRGGDSVLDVFSIEPEPATNSLIVAASDENLRMVRDLLDALTSDEAVGLLRNRRLELIPLEQLSAENAARAAVELYAREENERRGEGSVRVVPNTRLGSLLVSGTPGDVDRIREIVYQLDRADITAVREVRRFELTTANAFEIVRLLESLLAGESVARLSGTEQASLLRYFRQTVDGEDVTEAPIDPRLREQVQLAPELRTNSVVVTAPKQVMELIASIVTDLDTTEAGSRRINRYVLKNADARAMAEVLSDLFNLEESGNRFVLVPSRIRSPGNDEQLGEQTLTPVPDERQQLAITVDARTNTLLVSGTDEFLELVGDVVVELDAIEAQERDQFVVTLQNASADEVERVLSQYFSEEAERLRATLGPEEAASAARRLEREVTVVGDQLSQKVLVSSSPRYRDSVEQIIRELDAAPPQVLIQVLLAEVTLDSDDQFGLDFLGRTEDNGLSGSTLAGGAGSASVATVLGTANLTLASDDFDLLVRALEVQGKLEVLSNPQVTVNNNQPARIQVGENVALAEDVERLDNGNTRANVRREDVGVIVDVTPSISADGFVRLEIQPEISDVTNRTTQITEDFSSPIISTRRVETTVTVKDGQTVVIGGLIQNLFEEREARVPILGDIPILGIPFRTKDVTSIKTELLVILTPKIIPGSFEGVDAFRKVTQDAINRTTDPERLLRILPESDLKEGPTKSPGAPAKPRIELSPDGPYAPGLEPEAIRGEEGV